jgi:hypothetical protein
MSGTTSNGAWSTDGKWDTLTASQKLAFVGKLVLALCTFGFVYPNILD